MISGEEGQGGAPVGFPDSQCEVGSDEGGDVADAAGAHGEFYESVAEFEEIVLGVVPVIEGGLEEVEDDVGCGKVLILYGVVEAKVNTPDSGELVFVELSLWK